MAQCFNPDILRIEEKYESTLCIRDGFSQMLKDPSYCYKFYWLEAIVKLISEGKTETTFDQVINEMICNAWYSVQEFHIHLSGMQDGQVRDGLERAVLKLAELSGDKLNSNAPKIDILNAIAEHDDNAEFRKAKVQLTKMVPYRALAGFFTNLDQGPDWERISIMVDYINRVNRDKVKLPYTMGESTGLSRQLFFNAAWVDMIQDNTVSILGWIQYEKVKWLQNNNPEVPGLVYKLAPSDTGMRHLNKVHDLWDGVLELTNVSDVFTGDLVDPRRYDVDHFIPWTFVMNDELWNLMPMDSNLNSSKSNKLPKWEPFFDRFARNQFLLYGFIQEKPGIHKLFENCYRDNLHSIWAQQELYHRGNDETKFKNILYENMRPVYDSARRQGYEEWKIEEKLYGKL